MGTQRKTAGRAKPKPAKKAPRSAAKPAKKATAKSAARKPTAKKAAPSAIRAGRSKAAAPAKAASKKLPAKARPVVRRSVAPDPRVRPLGVLPPESRARVSDRRAPVAPVAI